MYTLLKFFHIVGVILFVGNIIVTGWWKTLAARTKNPQIIAHAQRQVTLTDFIFTAGGSFLVGAMGILMVTIYQLDWNLFWLKIGIVLFALSGVLWVVVLIPIQIKQARLAVQFVKTEEIPTIYWTLERWWLIVGTLATLLPLGTAYFMIVKPI
jgi:uncharacterized membrane protein